MCWRCLATEADDGDGTTRSLPHAGDGTRTRDAADCSGPDEDDVPGSALQVLRASVSLIRCLRRVRVRQGRSNWAA